MRMILLKTTLQSTSQPLAPHFMYMHQAKIAQGCHSCGFYLESFDLSSNTNSTNSTSNLAIHSFVDLSSKAIHSKISLAASF